MIRALATLLVFQWVGEVAARVLDLPIPGPVLGMAGLLAWLIVRGQKRGDVPESLEQVAGGLLAHLSLLFVPAGVGVLVHLDAIQAAVGPLVAAIVLGTPIAMAATALLARLAGAGDRA